MKKRNLFFGLFMIVVYLGMASLLIFSGFFNINKVLSVVMGVLFLAYGIYRAVRLWRKGA